MVVGLGIMETKPKTVTCVTGKNGEQVTTLPSTCRLFFLRDIGMNETHPLKKKTGTTWEVAELALYGASRAIHVDSILYRVHRVRIGWQTKWNVVE